MTGLGKGIKIKFKQLKTELEKEGSVLVALSGGVDSSLLAAVSKITLGDKAVAVTADSVTMTPEELQEARKFAKSIGIKHLIIKFDELKNPNFIKNPPNRCYYCKKELASRLRKIAAQEGLRAVVDGTNSDDLKEHRPGALALMEKGIISPLARAGLTKRDIRLLAGALGLSIANKPSMACLSSRFPYGEKITAKRLLMIAEAERFIKSLHNFRHLRVRVHGNIARIEVGRSERSFFFNEKLLDTLTDGLRKLGFVYVTMDVEGYRSGSMNEPLNKTLIPNKIWKVKAKRS